MKRIGLALLAAIAALLFYASLPLASVAVLTVSVRDQNQRKIITDASATYLDRQGSAITRIDLKTPGSWDNNLHWWSHSHHARSTLRPVDARRAVSVRIEATGCSTATIPVSLERRYEPFSLFLHGAGAAYFIYEFKQAVVLECSSG